MLSVSAGNTPTIAVVGSACAVAVPLLLFRSRRDARDGEAPPSLTAKLLRTPTALAAAGAAVASAALLSATAGGSADDAARATIAVGQLGVGVAIAAGAGMLTRSWQRYAATFALFTVPYMMQDLPVSERVFLIAKLGGVFGSMVFFTHPGSRRNIAGPLMAANVMMAVASDLEVAGESKFAYLNAASGVAIAAMSYAQPSTLEPLPAAASNDNDESSDDDAASHQRVPTTACGGLFAVPFTLRSPPLWIAAYTVWNWAFIVRFDHGVAPLGFAVPLGLPAVVAAVEGRPEVWAAVRGVCLAAYMAARALEGHVDHSAYEFLFVKNRDVKTVATAADAGACVGAAVTVLAIVDYVARRWKTKTHKNQ